ncbi:hypothetical protein HPB50_009614 [Hyalomma asiaticum]|uniref:Uncharacterized protein n=1 Tax=Hyalomma asiaticum TaxID=266040 RepID=A0ACB7THI1_HYAAI|nr:hypothetical protein HPB50_009614 [Hyalomma asiaticum]
MTGKFYDKEVDVLITGLQSYCHQQLVSMQQLNLQLAQLPKLQQGVQDLMNTIGELEGMFEEVELRLVSLEDVIETQALQEKQLDERFKLALYGEKKKGHFESLKDKLEEDHQTLLRQLEEQEREVLRERQETFGEVFRRDLEAYKEQGTLHRIKAVHDAQVDLEDIDLEGNDEEREALDEFLADVISTTGDSEHGSSFVHKNPSFVQLSSQDLTVLFRRMPCLSCPSATLTVANLRDIPMSLDCRARGVPSPQWTY